MRVRCLLGFAVAVLALPRPAPAAPGDLDTTFGGTGTVVTTLTAGFDTAWGVVAQPDGKIVAAGQTANANTDFALVRYDAAGALDAGFGSGGIVTTNFATGNDIGRALLRQPDGKLVVAGQARGTNNDFALARYNADGSLDTSFGTGGKVTTAIGTGNEVANALARQTDGKLVAAGNVTLTTLDFALVRYNADGSLDTSFGTGGKVTTAVGSSTDSANAVAVQADGKIVAAGYTVNGAIYDIAVVRYNADGSLDTTFDGDGTVITAVGPGYAIATAIVAQADGRITVAGYTTNGTNLDLALVRYNGDGSLDTTFDGDGTVQTPVGTGDDQGKALLRQADGKLVVAGLTHNGANYDLALAKYDANGSLDTAFGTGGLVTTSVSGGDDGANAVALQADGKVVAAGFTGPASTPDFLVARYANAVCGDSVVESGEACDAGGANGAPGSCCAAACTFVTAGTECRAGAGDCDVAETCTGSSAACPADAFATAGTECRAAAGVCDVAETCTGSGPACPTDVLQPSSTVCRPGSGDSCDPSESCTGTSANCPANVVTPSGTVCRTGSGDLCDPTETCTGVAGQACPADSVSGAFVTCRPPAGACDVAENCPGTAGQPCPANAFVTAGQTCRASAGFCDVVETCTGSGAACPTDVKSTAVCRPSAGPCDVAETCDGVGDICPVNALQPAATLCRPATAVCDLDETCTGSSATCPADTGLPDTDGDTICDAIDNCDTVDNDQTDADHDFVGDACDPCTNRVPTVPSKTTLILSKLFAPATDDKLTFKGSLLNVPDSPPNPTIDPVANGLRILITDSLGETPIDATIPGGAYDPGTRAGWKVNATGTAWKYSDPGSPANGIYNARLKAYPATPGKYKFAVKGKNGNYAVTTANLPLRGTLVIETPNAVSGQCGETAFQTPPTKPSCSTAGSGKTVKCK